MKKDKQFLDIEIEGQVEIKEEPYDRQAFVDSFVEWANQNGYLFSGRISSGGRKRIGFIKTTLPLIFWAAISGGLTAIGVVHSSGFYAMLGAFAALKTGVRIGRSFE